MPPQRPDLSRLDAEVRAYIEHLEEALAAAETRRSRPHSVSTPEPSESPTTVQVITISHNGRAKRTPRHLYGRQRRGGMGVFDLDSGEDDPPAFLVIADEGDPLVVLTDRSRFFPLAVRDIVETEVRGHGQSIVERLPLQPDEHLAAVLPGHDGAILYLLSRRGWVRRVSGSQLAHVKPGTVLEVRAGHSLAAACWGNGGDMLFIATRNGKGIRFAERQVPVQGGCLGLRLDPREEAFAITTVPDDGRVFLLSDEGKGAVRLMSGFRANKAPGAGGKVAMKVERLVGAQTVSADDDVFALSRLGKIIRFAAADVPAKEGVVQGVHCMNLRADQAVACAVSDAGAPIAE